MDDFLWPGISSPDAKLGLQELWFGPVTTYVIAQMISGSILAKAQAGLVQRWPNHTWGQPGSRIFAWADWLVMETTRTEQQYYALETTVRHPEDPFLPPRFSVQSIRYHRPSPPEWNASEHSGSAPISGYSHQGLVFNVPQGRLTISLETDLRLGDRRYQVQLTTHPEEAPQIGQVIYQTRVESTPFCFPHNEQVFTPAQSFLTQIRPQLLGAEPEA